MIELLAIMVCTVAVLLLWRKTYRWAEKQQPELARQLREAREPMSGSRSTHTKSKVFGEIRLAEDITVSEAKARDLEAISRWVGERILNDGFKWRNRWDDRGECRLVKRTDAGDIDISVYCETEYESKVDDDGYEKITKIAVEVDWDLCFSEELEQTLKSTGMRLRRFDDMLMISGQKEGSLAVADAAVKRLLALPVGAAVSS